MSLRLTISRSPGRYEDVAKEISNHQERNLYYHPYTDAIPLDRQKSCKIAYIKGLTEALNCFDDDGVYRPLYDELIKLYNNNPYI